MAEKYFFLKNSHFRECLSRFRLIYILTGNGEKQTTRMATELFDPIPSFFINQRVLGCVQVANFGTSPVNHDYNVGAPNYRKLFVCKHKYRVLGTTDQVKTSVLNNFNVTLTCPHLFYLAPNEFISRSLQRSVVR